MAELIYFSLQSCDGSKTHTREGRRLHGPVERTTAAALHPMAVHKGGRSHRDVTHWFRSLAVGFQPATSGLSVQKREDSIVGSVGGSGGEK